LFPALSDLVTAHAADRTVQEQWQMIDLVLRILKNNFFLADSGDDAGSFFLHSNSRFARL
jgi:hypothetical protein